MKLTTTRNSRLATVGMALALSSAVLMNTGSDAMAARGGGKHKASNWGPVAKKAQREVARRDRAWGPRPKWSKANKTKVQKIIRGAMKRHDGDILAAYKDVDGRRHKKRNFYNQNLAIASDYFRARKDVRYGISPSTERKRIALYSVGKIALGNRWTRKIVGGDLKQARPFRRGNGPVSPYSGLAARYMHKGVTDEAKLHYAKSKPPAAKQVRRGAKAGFPVKKPVD
jgi:hypothetical protein